jgi:uncharacterized protein (DUF697 family)
MPNPAERLLHFILERVDDADEAAALERVRALREQHPDWTKDQLVEQLIKRKAQQTAAIGAATAGSGLVPGLGTVVALTIGSVADFGATLRLQTELVLEIGEVHGRRLGPAEKRQVVLLVGGLGAGSGQALSRGGARLSVRLTQRYAQRWIAKAIPFAGIAASAGSNALATYLIGRRAHAYFAIGPAAVGSWAESLRALTGMDERRLTSWLSEAGRGAARGMRRLPPIRLPWRRQQPRLESPLESSQEPESTSPPSGTTPPSSGAGS